MHSQTRTHVTGLARLVHRWPVALGIAAAAGILYGADDRADAAPIIFIAAVIYLAVAAFGGQRATLPVFVGMSVVFGIFQVLDQPEWVFALVTGLVLTGIGVANRNLLTGGLESWQAPALLGFALVGVLGLAIDPQIGVYVVAAGLIGHALWDVVHLRLNRVVARPYAQWCAVLDLVLGVGIIFVQ